MLEKTLESPLDCKEIQPVHSEGDQPWVFFRRNDAKAETPVLWPPDAKSWLIGKDWCREELGAEGEGDKRGWDGWMALPTWWTWVWVNSGSWWWTGRPGVLQFMGSQIVGHDWGLNWTEQGSECNEGGRILAARNISPWVAFVHILPLLFNPDDYKVVVSKNRCKCSFTNMKGFKISYYTVTLRMKM